MVVGYVKTSRPQNPTRIRFDFVAPIQIKREGLKSCFKSLLVKSRAVHGATICDVILPINT